MQDTTFPGGTGRGANYGTTRRARTSPAVRACALPFVAYLVAATVTLGLAVVYTSTDMQSQQPNKDIWQHVAALRALIAELGQAPNPFVVSDETSRHYHPMWVGTALLARASDLTVWQALTIASALSMAVLGAGVYAFGRVFFASPWGPLALLATMLGGWVIQPAHTGFHSFHTLLFAAFYPATTLVGLSLLSWALVIGALGRRGPALGILLMPLVALMFATHQLGAAIGLIVAGCFVLFWPEGRPGRRLLVSAAILAGLGLSLLWPFHNPLELVLRPGNSDWEGGTNFFNLAVVSVFTLPIAIGVLGLRDARGRAILAAIVVLSATYAIGFAGPQVTGRFLMPITLCLQIGLAGLVLSLLDHPRIQAIPRAARGAAAGIGGLIWLGLSLMSYADVQAMDRLPDPTPYTSAEVLTADIPDTEEVLATDIIAWPVVATGQRVHSVPWPEPGITDLATRREATAALLDPHLSAEARLVLAKALGIRTVITARHSSNADIRAALQAQAVRVTEHGVLVRFDLVAE